MKHLLTFSLILLFFQAFSQAPAQERADTIWGVALVLDTVQVWTDKPDPEFPQYIGEYEARDQLTTSVWTAYAISRYTLQVDVTTGTQRPRVRDVRYYRLEDCVEIPVRRMFYFKQQ